MKIFIIANFAERLKGQNDGRFEYLADMLVRRGYDVTFITSDFDHFTKKHRDFVSEKYSYKIQLIHEPGYKTNVSLKRLYSHRIWGHNVYKYLQISKKPDLVYIAVPSLTVGVKTVEYCKVNKIRLVADVQDLWPEAFFLAIRNKILQNCFLPIKWYVNKIYKSADLLLAVSQTYLDRAMAVNHHSDGYSVFLGNDGAAFDVGRIKYSVKKPSKEFWIVYIGTLGHSYDIPCVINAIKKLNGKSSEGDIIRFIIIGDGPLKKTFEDYAQMNGVNCEFTGGLAYQEMVGRMCSCDVVMNPIVKGAPQSITNKVGDYALSGLPVISTQENPEYRQLVEEYQCGINCECGNSDQVADAINTLAKNPALRIQMGENARRLGVEKFDRRSTYIQIIDALEKCVSCNV